jgi:hypothetical protein
VLTGEGLAGALVEFFVGWLAGWLLGDLVGESGSVCDAVGLIGEVGLCRAGSTEPDGAQATTSHTMTPSKRFHLFPDGPVPCFVLSVARTVFMIIGCPIAYLN